jgi:hypothetical protein
MQAWHCRQAGPYEFVCRVAPRFLINASYSDEGLSAAGTGRARALMAWHACALIRVNFPCVLAAS